MRVRLLGGLAVEGIAERDLGSRKGRTLLKLLALARGAPVGVDAIAEVLWGDEPPSRPGDQVGVLVSRLRGVLGPSRLPRSDAGYALVADWLDVVEVAALGAAAATALADGRIGAARAAADAALALARGPLLPDEDGDWVEPERAAAAAAIAHARSVAVRAAAAAGDHGAAAAQAEEALAHDPYDEVVLRALMRSHVAAGRPSSALAAYARVRARLAEDLGVPPTAETEDVHGEALAAADGDEVAPPPSGTLVGRGRELAALDAAAARAPGLVLVRGPAGIGKTTLVSAWSSGRSALIGRCDELGRDLPLQPVADAVATHLDAIGPDAARRLLGDEAPVLAELLGRGTAPPDLDPAAGQGRLFAALLAVAERAAPVLVVDDLHHAGRSSLEWLAFARRRASRLLVVATSRPGGPSLPEAELVELGPLDLEAVAVLVGADVAEEVLARTGGHPLLVASGATPAVVDAAARALGTAGEEAVRAAAVLGDDVDLDLLAAVLARPAVEVVERLEAASDAGLLVERGAGFALRHALVREALAAEVSGPRRALWHRTAAVVLAGRPRPDPLSVAVHAREGGDHVLAARWFAAAAERAVARFDADAAAALADQAVALDPSPAALSARAWLRIGLFRVDEAAADAAAAVAAGGGARALETAGWAAYYRRRYDEAGRWADEGVAVAADPALRASCLALAGRVRHAAGDLPAATDRLEEAIGGPLAARAVAAVWLSGLRAHQGRPDDALSALDGVALDESGSHVFVPLHGRFARVVALGHLRRPREALLAADDLVEVAARAGAVGARFVAVAANMRAWVLRWTGSYDEAEDEVLRGLDASSASDVVGPASDSMAEPYWVGRLDLAEGRLLCGDADGAAALEATLGGLDAWRGTMAWHQRHRLGLLRARLALLDGDPERAAALATAVREDAAARGARRYELLGAALAGTAVGRSADLDALAIVVAELPACAGLDGWRSMAELAAATGVERWAVDGESWRGALRSSVR